MIKQRSLKAVITCAGLGTRLLPFTKELPKEMAPIFYQTESGIHVIPLIQLIFEKLYDLGIREFCFVTGKTKRAIENHFTPDLSTDNIMKSFNKKLSDSKIFWITQNFPKGFGDAVKYVESFVGSEKFILQAGDVDVIPNKKNILESLVDLANKSDLDVVLLVRKVKEPKRHGIVTLENENNTSRVMSAVEKPDNPPTNIGIMPIYMLNKTIFSALGETKPGKNNEIQLTDAIQKLIEDGKKVEAIRAEDDKFLDVGTPEAYWQALKDSHCLYEESL